jgi:serine/threonine protein kinase
MNCDADTLAGQVLDDTYRLGERIGEGGMGAVYAARHLGTDRPVAIKVLLPEVVGNQSSVERFRREARAAGRLRHPNVVDVTDFGVARVDEREIAYLVMEFLEGSTLRKLLDERGRMPLDVAVEIVEQVASAFDAAHAAGIVHRDLKPENVWLVPDARGGYTVRVLDFGIAQLGQLDAMAAGPGDAPNEGLPTVLMERIEPPAADGAAAPERATEKFQRIEPADLGGNAAPERATEKFQRIDAAALGGPSAAPPGEPKRNTEKFQRIDPLVSGDPPVRQRNTEKFQRIDPSELLAFTAWELEGDPPPRPEPPRPRLPARAPSLIERLMGRRGAKPARAEPAPQAEENTGPIAVLATPREDTTSAETIALGDLGAGYATGYASGYVTGSTLEEWDAAQEETGTHRLTHVGAIMGTPSYMSPEQWQRRPLGPASDIYSLGVLTWEMLEGKRPFVGAIAELSLAHQHRPPPALETQPPKVAAVVARAMAKNPGDRFASAGAFAGCLRVAAENAGMVLRRAMALYASRWPEFRRVAWRSARVPMACTGALVLACLAGVLLHKPDLAQNAFYAAVISGPLAWTAVTLSTNASFALVMERLRTRPFENIDAAALAVELRARLGLPKKTGWLRTMVALARFYNRTEARSKKAIGDLAFFVRFLEGLTVDQLPARSAVLAGGVRRTYRVVAAAVTAGLVTLPLVEAGLVLLAWSPFGTPSVLVALGVGAILMPLNAMLVNPVSSSALALLYFRARQASGEDTGMNAVLQGRL